jgi:hypothetical protein
VTPSVALSALLAVSATAAPRLGAGTLPVCSNRVIVEVVKRVGCTLGDVRCWNTRGGFCNDYVEERIRAERPVEAFDMGPVAPGQVAKGDVAVFLARAHYAYVEAVVRDRSGRAVAVDVAEYNYGTCWVDKNAMVTEKYKLLNRRVAVPIQDVDGGFLRHRRDR